MMTDPLGPSGQANTQVRPNAIARNKKQRIHNIATKKGVARNAPTKP